MPSPLGEGIRVNKSIKNYSRRFVDGKCRKMAKEKDEQTQTQEAVKTNKASTP
jgi:hypothetical protein